MKIIGSKILGVSFRFVSFHSLADGGQEDAIFQRYFFFSGNILRFIICLHSM